MRKPPWICFASKGKRATTALMVFVLGHYMEPAIELAIARRRDFKLLLLGYG
jgi:hypothetical protein